MMTHLKQFPNPVLQAILLFSLLLTSTFSTVSGQESNWTDLFDGKTLNGWEKRGGDANYEVVDGEIVGSTVPNTPNSFLCTERLFTDFELQLEFKVHPELNSGIQIRSNSLQDYKDGRVHGYQIEIDPADRAWTAGIYDESRRGWLDDHRDNNDARYAFKQDQWNHLRIVAAGNRIRTWLNGVPAADLTDSMTDRGFIALQVHGVGDRQDKLTVKWKNIRLMENPKLADGGEETIKELIPSASGMSAEELGKLTGSATPSADSIENKSLTLMLLSAPLVEGESGQAEDFSFIEDAPNPADLIREIQREGAGTMVQFDRIEEFTCRINGDRATGHFAFEVPDLYQGRANFLASKSNGNWKITEFRMPARGLSIVADSSGKWSHTTLTPVFGTGTTVEKLADGFSFTEGPSLGPGGKIYFNDIPNNTTHVFDPATNEVTIFRENNGQANGMFWTAAGALISCEGGNRVVSRRWNGNETLLAQNYQDKKLNSPNDCVLDTQGGIYFTDPRYGNKDNLEQDVQGVYYLSRDGQLTRVIDDLKQPNGIIMSPDFRVLYVADFGDSKTWSYQVASDGKLKNKQLFAEIGSDGMTVDRQGNVYLTWQGAIVVFSVRGEKIAELTTPEPPANCLLVGDTLYITARTGFYRVKTSQLGIQ